MKNKLVKIIVCLILAQGLFTTCTLQKRVHRKGYHVVWNHRHSSEQAKQPNLETKELAAINNIVVEEAIVSANPDRSVDLGSLKRKPLLVLNPDTCGDVLLLQNADELKVKVLEIDEQTIKYKRCDNVSGPTYSISKNKVALIRYANGIQEKVVQEAPTKPSDQHDAHKPEMPRKVNVLGLSSLLLYVFGVILSRGMSGTLLTGSIGVLLLILSVAPLVMAYISLFQFKREPDKYKGRWMPVTVVCMYLAALLLIALVLAAFAATMSGAVGAVVILCLLLFLLFLGILIAALVPKAK